MVAGYDIIGDVHGEALALEVLLHKLGYVLEGGVFHHKDGDRTALFVGDYVNHGSENARTLDIIRSMVEQGSAQAILGNHELAHIRYATKNEDGEYVLPHGAEYEQFFKECFDEMPFGSDEHTEMVEWFKTLPLFIETEDFIAVHANYEALSVANVLPYLTIKNTFNEKAYASVNRNTNATFFNSVYSLLFGPNMKLPEDVKKSLDQYEIETNGKAGYNSWRRLYWWRTGDDISAAKVLGLDHLELTQAQHNALETALSIYRRKDASFGELKKSVVFGHYSIIAEPHLTSKNAACLDFKGYLTACRYNVGDEGIFHEDQLVSVALDNEDLRSLKI